MTKQTETLKENSRPISFFIKGEEKKQVVAKCDHLKNLKYSRFDDKNIFPIHEIYDYLPYALLPSFCYSTF